MSRRKDAAALMLCAHPGGEYGVRAGGGGGGGRKVAEKKEKEVG